MITAKIMKLLFIKSINKLKDLKKYVRTLIDSLILLTIHVNNLLYKALHNVSRECVASFADNSVTNGGSDPSSSKDLEVTAICKQLGSAPSKSHTSYNSSKEKEK